MDLGVGVTVGVSMGLTCITCMCVGGSVVRLHAGVLSRESACDGAPPLPEPLNELHFYACLHIDSVPNEGGKDEQHWTVWSRVLCVCVCVCIDVYVCVPRVLRNLLIWLCAGFIVENNECVCICVCMRVMQTSDLGEVADEIPCTECLVVVLLYILCMSSYISREKSSSSSVLAARLAAVPATRRFIRSDTCTMCHQADHDWVPPHRHV